MHMICECVDAGDGAKLVEVVGVQRKDVRSSHFVGVVSFVTLAVSTLPFAQPEKIKALLDNVELGSTRAGIMEKIDGMKYLLAVSFVVSACSWP